MQVDSEDFVKFSLKWELFTRFNFFGVVRLAGPAEETKPCKILTRQMEVAFQCAAACQVMKETNLKGRIKC